jgi:hypothetical protein
MKRGVLSPVPFAAWASLLLLGFAGSVTGQKPSSTETLATWTQIEKVLQHPRCLNCHQDQSPLQGNLRRPHIPHVVRGFANHGVGAMKCEGCHNQSGNNETSRTPGAPHWQLAPLSMKWQGLTGHDLCLAFKDKNKNGGRSLDEVIAHIDHDALVNWAWNPGADREPIPIPHGDFIKILQRWVNGGALCP